MRKQSKRLIAGLLTTAMVLPMTVSLVQPMSAAAGNVVEESTFERKIIPWRYETAFPARQRIDVDNGAAHIFVQSPLGASKMQDDLQFVYKNLTLKKGHEYEISFKAKANRSGIELASKIASADNEKTYVVLCGSAGNFEPGPDMDGRWGDIARLTTEYQEFSGKFKPTENIDGAKWVFAYAYDMMGYGGNVQQGDEIWFDDLVLRDLSDSDFDESLSTYGYTSRTYSMMQNNYISVNQLGYYPELAKIAVLGDNSGDSLPAVDGRFVPQKIELKGSYDYELVQVSDEKVVFTGKTGTVTKDHDSGDNVCIIDFSIFNTPGEYYLRIKDKEWRSFPFRIDTDLYENGEQNLLTDAVNYFYQNRAGMDIYDTYITSGQKSMLAHPANMYDGEGTVVKYWPTIGKITADELTKAASSVIDTKGGWYSGSDVGKFMSESGIALWTLQNLYERAIRQEGGTEKFEKGSGTVVIPDTGEKMPDLLVECKYELDFMEKMKVQEDETTWGSYAGMYYHGLRGVGFQADTLMADTSGTYAVLPPTFAATLHYAACAAQGARLFAPYDKTYAEHLLKEAKAAYQAYKQNWYEAAANEKSRKDSLYAPDLYADWDTKVLDEAYWAASELFITAKEMKDADAAGYLKEITDYSKAFEFEASISGIINGTDVSFTMLNGSEVGAAGSLSLLMHEDLLSADQRRKLEDTILSVADAYLDTEEAQGYGIPYQYNREVSNLDEYLFSGSVDGFGFDSNSCVLTNMMAMAYAYDLTGDTKYLNGTVRGMDYLLGTNPLSYSFITGYGSYHAKNPAHRFWTHELDPSLPEAPAGVMVSGPNAGLQDEYMHLLGMTQADDIPSQRCYADSVEAISTNNLSLSSNAALAWIASFLQEAGDKKTVTSKIPGDADGNGKVGVSDAVTMVKYLVGESTVKSPADADLNADNNLNAIDLSLLKQMLLADSSAEPDFSKG